MTFNKNLAAMLLFCLSISPGTSQGRNAAFYKAEGDKHRVQQNRLRAIEDYKRSVRANKNYVPALTALGSILRETGANNEALSYLARAHKLEPRNEKVILELALTFLKLNGLKQARTVLNKGLALSPNKADFNYLMADIYLKENRQYLAKRKLETIIKSNPGHYRSYLSLGEIYLREKRYNRARDAFEKARLIQPENPSVFLKLAQIKLNQVVDEKNDLLYSTRLDKSIFNEPISLLMNAKGFDNSMVEANMGLARLYALLRECEKAGPYLDTVLQVNPAHYVARYYHGFCDPGRSLKTYPALLKENYNDDITRYFYEHNMTRIYRKRTHPQILRAARQHYNWGRNLQAAYRQSKALFEYRWAMHLFPSYLKAHQQMLDYYRTQGDFIKMKDELAFLRKMTNDIKYDDMYEQYIQRRRGKLFVREGFNNPMTEKNPTGVFVFYFKPENPFGNYPDAGQALADTLVFALKHQGRLSVLSARTRNFLYQKLKSQNYFGQGAYYNGSSGKLVQKELKELVNNDQVISKQDANTLRYSPLRYAVSGSYKEIPGGLSVTLDIVDLKSGITFGNKRLTVRGRGFLRDIAMGFANHIYQKIPFSGRVLKISRNGAVVNLGKRDGIDRNSRLQVFRNQNKVADLQISQVDMDILWAKTRKLENIYQVRPGDEIRIAQK